MRNLIRYFNQNRKKILLILLIIVFLIILVRVLNYIVRKNIQDERNNITNIHVDKDTSTPDEAIISGEEIPQEKANEDKEVIDNFVQACNDKDYTKAYNMLTNDCKNVVFGGTIESFIKNYCENIFKTSKTCKLEGWLSKIEGITYKVTYLEDNILETGGISEGLNYTDYITVTDENGETKLNIYSFINSVKLSKEASEDNIDIKINEKNIYMDYTIYTITVINNRDNTILLSDNSDNKQICLVDSNDNEYISYLNEIPQYNLILNPKQQKQFNIRFAKGHSSENNIKFIRFKNIYLNYDVYKNNPNDENLEKVKIDIKL